MAEPTYCLQQSLARFAEEPRCFGRKQQHDEPEPGQCDLHKKDQPLQGVADDRRPQTPRRAAEGGRPDRTAPKEKAPQNDEHQDLRQISQQLCAIFLVAQICDDLGRDRADTSFELRDRSGPFQRVEGRRAAGKNHFGLALAQQRVELSDQTVGMDKGLGGPDIRNLQRNQL